jgi:hypothetical protein
VGSACPIGWQSRSSPQSVGKAEAALKYLAAYLYRIAISNKNILCCQNGLVTFRYREKGIQTYKTMTLPALEFIRRFLQHALPKGFQKVRYYGFLSPKKKSLFQQIQLLLKARLIQTEKVDKKDFSFNCPHCGKQMILVKQTHWMLFLNLKFRKSSPNDK